MTITYRPGTLADTYAIFQIMQTALVDLGERHRMMAITGGDDPAVLQSLWDRRRAMLEHLCHTGEQFWIAEADGRPVGYTRSILRDGIRELTEFFVTPGGQSSGVGRGLLERVFSPQGARHRAIIATTDLRALARYLKSGVYARFPIVNFTRPARVSLALDPSLEAAPLTGALQELEPLREIDRQVLGHTRDVDHTWLMAQRQGFLYRRAGRVVGYGYVHEDGGPFALLDPGDYPAVLAQAEQAAGQTFSSFYLEVPLINQGAVDYLLAQGYQMSAFMTFFMSDQPFGRFEQYILPSPPYFL